MMREKPPFRADVVGSILRTAPLKEVVYVTSQATT